MVDVASIEALSKEHASHTGSDVELNTDDLVRLQVLPDAEAVKDWDGYMAGFSTPSFHQCYAWGEYRRMFGWKPLRCLLLSHDANLLGMAQCLVREFPLCRTVLAWVPGGPLLKANCWRGFRDALKRHFNPQRLYVRIEPSGPGSVERESELIGAGWKLPQSRLNSGKTIVVSLKENELKRRSRLTGNWRHNLVRGERQNFIVQRWTPSVHTNEALLAIYREMIAFKAIPLAMDRDSIGHLSKAFGNRFIVVAVKTQAGELLAARGGGLAGTMGYDLFAATSELGRRIYASYVALWRLLEELKREGADSYDLGGVDSHKVPGVYAFKCGVGGSIVERVGEWEWSHSTFVSCAVNLWVKNRVGSLV